MLPSGLDQHIVHHPFCQTMDVAKYSFFMTLSHRIVAAAQPSLDDALRAICQPVEGRPPVGRVVVQPHLLFPGHVETQVTTRLAQAREEQPQVDWLQVPRLGPANEVARALFERGLEAAWAQRFRTTVPGR